MRISSLVAAAVGSCEGIYTGVDRKNRYTRGGAFSRTSLREVSYGLATSDIGKTLIQVAWVTAGP